MASSNTAWGIDIGGAGIKAIKLERSGEGVRVADFVIVPHKRVLTTPDIDENEAVRLTLGAFLSQFGDDVRGSTTVVSVAGHQAFARFAKLPVVNPKAKDVINIVKYEAVQQIPFPIEEVEWDYQLFTSEDTPEVEVGIFAITKERVQEKLALWGEAGLVPSGVTISHIAAFSAIAYDLGLTPSSPGTIILDIGTQATDLIIAEGGRVWIRTFPLGGHQFTQAIAETFKLTYSKAEKLKAEAETSKYQKHVLQALKPILSDLVQDVQRSISYYQDTHPSAKIERLIGIGSTFKLFGLRKLLSQQLGMEVFRHERFKSISVDGPAAADFEAVSLNLVTAYGLALQGLEEAPISANLIPEKVVRDALWAKKTPYFVTAAAMLALAGVASMGRPFLDNSSWEETQNLQAVKSVLNTGRTLKSEWEQVKSANTFTFHPANAGGLVTGREIFEAINNDANAIIETGRDQVGPDAPVSQGYTLQSLESQYLAPQSALALNGGSAGADDGGGRGGRGGRGDSGGGDTVGEFGALKLTMVIETQNPGRDVFLNETVLRWLRDNADRAGVPYEIMDPPKIDHVRSEEIVASGRPGAPTGGPPRGGSPGSGRGFGGPAVDGGGGGDSIGRGTGLGGSPTDGGRGGRGGRGTEGGEQGGAPAIPDTGLPGADALGGEASPNLDAIAPLPPMPVVATEGETIIRYTVTWHLSLRDPAAAPWPAEEANGENEEVN